MSQSQADIVGDLAGKFNPSRNGFPAHLDMEQQGLFILGFHHAALVMDE